MTQKYRRGDIVTVMAVVETQYADTDDMTSIRNKVSIRVEGQSTMLLDPDALTLVTPFFAAGERVQRVRKAMSDGKPAVRGTVIAMDGEDVWVKLDNGNRGTIPAVELEPSTESALQLRSVA